MATSLFFQPFFMLSGFSFPIRNMPQRGAVVHAARIRCATSWKSCAAFSCKGAGFATLWPQIAGAGGVRRGGAGLERQRFHKQLE